ncbi:Regulator_of chromosome condensation (RCC1) repeat-containing protein [Hexamita inflata]|uniref:Regulator_of chromosome condensation (RCC1) repeat-containing protein n=1 Tax=Hexamita inflata TaxID=28002 RepID=A0ABP1IK49_9EUKA
MQQLLKVIFAETAYYIGRNPYDAFAGDTQNSNFSAVILPASINKHISFGNNTFFLTTSDGALRAYGSSESYELGSVDQIIIDPISRPTLFMDKKVKKMAIGQDHSMILLSDGRLYWQGAHQHPQYKEQRSFELDISAIPTNEKIVNIGCAAEVDYIQTNVSLYYFRFCAFGLCGKDYANQGALDQPLDVKDNVTAITKFQFPPELIFETVFFYGDFIIVQDYYGNNFAYGNWPCSPQAVSQLFLADFSFDYLVQNTDLNSILYILKNGTIGACGKDFRFSLSKDLQFQLPNIKGKVLDIASGTNGYYILTENFFYVYGQLNVNGVVTITKYGWFQFQRMKNVNKIATNSKWILLYNNGSIIVNDTQTNTTVYKDNVTVYVIGFGVVPLFVLIGVILWVVNTCEKKYAQMLQKGVKSD